MADFIHFTPYLQVRGEVPPLRLQPTACVNGKRPMRKENCHRCYDCGVSLFIQSVCSRGKRASFTLLPLVSVLVAEVTQPSLGVGYEMGRAVQFEKKTLCLFRPDSGRREFHFRFWRGFGSGISGGKKFWCGEMKNFARRSLCVCVCVCVTAGMFSGGL